jgi:LacI family transcriptional regulator
VRVPEELAVVGFDDIPFPIPWQSTLTTVRQPFFEMGQRGLEQLLQLISASNRRQGATPVLPATDPAKAAAPLRIQLPTQLIVRESCGAALAQSQSAAARHR